jgi:heme oxygenase (biliverdin-IX-beta and delta-forming)
MNSDARSTAIVNPFLSRLRLATRDTHVAIERSLALTEPGLTLDGYQRVLEKFYGYYQPVEEQLRLGRSRLADWLDVPGRGKTPWLKQDLIRFHPARELPLCGELPAMDGPAACFGCMYVLEGATLGGVIISRHILENLGVTPLSGGRFFHGYGERTGSMWQQFRAGLGAFAQTQTERDQEAVIASARATFETLRHWCELKDSQ